MQVRHEGVRMGDGTGVTVTLVVPSAAATPGVGTPPAGPGLPRGTGDLPFTGLPLVALLTLAVVLLVLGTSLLASTRRSR